MSRKVPAVETVTPVSASMKLAVKIPNDDAVTAVKAQYAVTSHRPEIAPARGPNSSPTRV